MGRLARIHPQNQNYIHQYLMIFPIPRFQHQADTAQPPDWSGGLNHQPPAQPPGWSGGLIHQPSRLVGLEDLSTSPAAWLVWRKRRSAVVSWESCLPSDHNTDSPPTGMRPYALDSFPTISWLDETGRIQPGLWAAVNVATCDLPGRRHHDQRWRHGSDPVQHPRPERAPDGATGWRPDARPRWQIPSTSWWSDDFRGPTLLCPATWLEPWRSRLCCARDWVTGWRDAADPLLPWREDRITGDPAAPGNWRP